MRQARIREVALISAFFVAGAALAGVLVLVIGAQDIRLTFNADVNSFWTRFYYLFAASILVERAVEVYLKISGLDGDTTGPERSENSPATTAALTAALTVSVLLALVGLRILNALVTLDPPPQGVNPELSGTSIVATLFFGIDVLISAGLMAGGSVVFHPLIKALTLIFEGMKTGAEGRLMSIEGNFPPQNTNADRSELTGIDLSNDEFGGSRALAALGLATDELNLAEPAMAGARLLKEKHPEVVFTSGRRTIASQAQAMAENVMEKRDWIKATYTQSAQRNVLQKWIDDHPGAKDVGTIASGLAGVMASWTDADKLNISRHLAGLAFDIQPIPGTAGDPVKASIRNLPYIRKFLAKEGELVPWYVEFRTQ